MNLKDEFHQWLSAVCGKDRRREERREREREREKGERQTDTLRDR
jgi:hypothetical protein